MATGYVKAAMLSGKCASDLMGQLIVLLNFPNGYSTLPYYSLAGSIVKRKKCIIFDSEKGMVIIIIFFFLQEWRFPLCGHAFYRPSNTVNTAIRKRRRSFRRR